MATTDRRLKLLTFPEENVSDLRATLIVETARLSINMDSGGQTIWVVDAHSGDARRFIVRADEKLSAFVELERQALIVTFYLESIHADSCKSAVLLLGQRHQA